MEKQEFDKRMSEVSQVIHRYCLSRTANVYDAEDLTQEILLELYKSATNLRDDKAFYGFMWSVAGNVYKQWYKRKLRREGCEYSREAYEMNDAACGENDTAMSAEDEMFSGMEDNSDIRLLRRELTLLAEKYRRATVLYYFKNKSCSEISEILSVSESMVKYLLFKSRQIVKDGMNMERTYGVQSYNPKEMLLSFWGGVNNYAGVLKDKISQNILFACYNDKLSGEQVSLEIGVALPYLEEHLEKLVEYDLLRMDGNRYYTNIVIFTEEFTREADGKTLELKKRIAKLVEQTLAEKEDQIRAIGFAGSDMDENTYRWQMACFLLRRAIIEKLQNEVEPEYPTDKFGEKCFVWGQEKGIVRGESGLNPGICSLDNDRGDTFFFMDFKVNGEIVHHYFFNKLIWRNIFGAVAAGETDGFSENDGVLVAEMVKLGFIKNENDRLNVNAPVFTCKEYEKLCEVLDEASEKIKAEAESLMAEVAKILKDHAPTHLKKTASKMAFLRILGDAVSGPLSMLYRDKFMVPAEAADMLPTTYVLLKE